MKGFKLSHNKYRVSGLIRQRKGLILYKEIAEDILAKKGPPEIPEGTADNLDLFYFGITFLFEFCIDNIATTRLVLPGYRKAELLEVSVLDQGAVIGCVVFILVPVLFLLSCFGIVDFKSAAQIQLIQILVMRTGIPRFGISPERK